MPNLINRGDFIDSYNKFHERGFGYFLSKLKLKSQDRIINNWQKQIHIPVANWWQIPAMQKRWNQKISGSADVFYPQHVVERFFVGKKGLTMLSIGCGSGEMEIKFAETEAFSRIDAFDIAPQPISEAKQKAEKKNLKSLNFFVADALNFNYAAKKYDIIHFPQSLHHFADIEKILKSIKQAMRSDSLLVLNEYAGPTRFQFSSQRLRDSNKILRELPASLRKKKGLGKKNKIYAPGLIRMLITDPSEAMNSSAILPALHSMFKIKEEVAIGGNLLHFLLKDIAHNFLDANSEPELKKLFEKEDLLVEKEGVSDFIFGVYSL